MTLFQATIPNAQVTDEFVVRHYQREAVDAVHAEFDENGQKSTLIVAATGTGKTPILSLVARERDARCMVLAHRDLLISQLGRTLREITGKRVEVEMGDRWASPDAPIICSSFQTQYSGMDGEGRMIRFNPDDFDLLIVDEAHHAVSPAYKRVIDHYKQSGRCKVLGVTATPDRKDEKALGQIFDSVAYVYEARNAIEDGWLVPIRQTPIYVEDLDFSQCRTTAGDLNQKDLAEIVESEWMLHEVASATVEEAGERQTLIYTVTKDQAEALAEIINRYKPNQARFVTDAVTGMKRQRLFEEYGDRKFQYLVNVGVAGEGVDLPGVEVVVMARPTKSRALYSQALGRATRPLREIVPELNATPDAENRRSLIYWSDKPYCEVLDFVGVAGKHKLVTPADVLGGDYEEAVIDKANQNRDEDSQTENGRQPVDVLEELERARRELEEERQNNRRKLVKAKAQYTKGQIDPFNVFDMQPMSLRGWDHDKPATEKQIAAISRMTKGDVDASEWSRKHASQFMDKLVGRSKHNWCTYKQAKLLKKYGYDINVRFDVAKQIIDSVARNGWKPIPKSDVNEIINTT